MSNFRYKIAIDGGGTRCRGRLADRQGTVLAEYTGGSANIYSDYAGALAEIERVIVELFSAAGLRAEQRQESRLVAGLAGANVPSVQQKLINWHPVCAGHRVVSDVETACIGAHSGQPGAVFILGTGSQGAVWDGHNFKLLGGWGFKLSDLASGAILGQKALRLALLAHEKLVTHSVLTSQLMADYHHDPEKLLLWSTTATPADWASCVPKIFHCATQQDPHAVALIKQTVTELQLMVASLLSEQHSRLALMGGLAVPITPWLPDELQQRLVQPNADALQGAMLLSELFFN